MPSDPAQDDVFATVYPVTLLLERAVEPDAAALLAALQRRCGEVEPTGEGKGAMFAFPSRSAGLADAPQMPVMCAVSESEQPFSHESFVPELQQTWEWDEAEAALQRSTAMLLLTDFMAATLAPADRVAWYGQVVAAVADVVPLTAMCWRPSGKLVDPAVYGRAVEQDAAFGFVNVRMFNVGDGVEDEKVMDTLGLGALGLPDAQIHFRGALEPGQVAGFLHGVGRYVLANGPVIEDGHTVPGPQGDPWTCRHEEALVPPHRAVIDIEAGPFSAR